MNIIENNFQVEQSKEELKNADVLAVDIETYDHVNIESFGKIRLVQVAIKEEIFVFDLFKVELPQYLIDIFENENVVKIMHHGIFDMSHLIKYYHCKFENTFCTAISSRILSSGLKIKNTLQAVCKRFLDIDIDKSEQASDWGGDLTPSQIAYAAEDAKILIPLYEKLNAILKEKKLIHIGRMDFKIQEISSELKACGIEIDSEKVISMKKDILSIIPESIDIEEFVTGNKKSGIHAIDSAVRQLKEIDNFEDKFYPEIKIKWNRGFVIYQKNYNEKIYEFFKEGVKTIRFKNLWLPAVSVSAGDYKSRELLDSSIFGDSEEGKLLKAFSFKDYKVLDVIDKGKEFKVKYPGINKWQDEITEMVVRKYPIRLNTGRIIHTRQLGVDTVEIFRIMVESLISDFAKTFIVLLNKENGSLFQVNNSEFNLSISFMSDRNIVGFVERASKFVFGSSIPKHFYSME